MNKNMTHGGKRKGSGRKKSPVPMVTVSFKVPKPLKEDYKKLDIERKHEIRQKVAVLIEDELKLER